MKVKQLTKNDVPKKGDVYFHEGTGHITITLSIKPDDDGYDESFIQTYVKKGTVGLSNGYIEKQDFKDYYRKSSKASNLNSESLKTPPVDSQPLSQTTNSKGRV